MIHVCRGMIVLLVGGIAGVAAGLAAEPGFWYCKYTYPDGRVYIGNWKGSMRHGWGKMIYTNGDVYVGNWKEDLAHGEGTMTYAKGKGGEYIGNWKDGMRHGWGQMRYKNGKVYKGEWENGKRHGQGTMTYADGSVYDGNWVKDKKDTKIRRLMSVCVRVSGAAVSGAVAAAGMI